MAAAESVRDLEPGAHVHRTKEGIPMTRLRDDVWVADDLSCLFVYDYELKTWTAALTLPLAPETTLQGSVDGVRRVKR
jgi:hypothetical protein